MSLTFASLALAGVGLALTHDVLLAQDVDPSPRRWDYMATVIQIAGLGLTLLVTAIELRRRAARRLDTHREGTR